MSNAPQMSDSSEDSSSSENQYENDGFVVDDSEQEEDGKNPTQKPRMSLPVKRRHRLRKNEEQDLELIQENLGLQRKAQNIKQESVASEEEMDEDDQKVSLAVSIFGSESAVIKKEPVAQKFDPSECKANFLGAQNDVIRENDIPERLQKWLLNRQSPTEIEISREVDWMTEKFLQRSPQLEPDSLRNSIQTCIVYYRIEKFEIFYISAYLLHTLKPSLKSEEDLIYLANLEHEWGRIYAIKKSLGNKLGFEPPSYIQEKLDSTSGMGHYWEIIDLQAYFKFHVYPLQHALRICRQNNLQLLGSCLSPADFCGNFEAKMNLNTPETPSKSPQSIASGLICTAFPDELSVIKGACALEVAELIAFLRFREIVREKYLSFALVFTTPTISGTEKLDIFHPCYSVKNICLGKLVETWTEQQLTDAFFCEKEDLINFKIGLPWTEDTDDRIFELMKSYYIGDSADDEWNQYREVVLRQALKKLYQETAVDLKSELYAHMEEWLTGRIQQNFRAMLLKPAFGESNIVMSLVTTLTKTHLVILDSFGEVTHLQTFSVYLLKNNPSGQDAEKQSYEISQIQNIILTHKPEVIVIGANNLESVRLRSVIGSILEGLQSTDSLSIKLVMEPTDVPYLFSLSNRANQLLPANSEQERIAVSLGRYLQSPLTEILGLWADPTELQILNLGIHPQQSLLAEPRLLLALQTVAVSATSLCGVTINEVVDHPHLASLVQFLPGLGPVKSHALVRSIRSRLHGRLSMRVQLIAKHILGERVYDNVVGFVKIDYERDINDPLDSTRIHPNQYQIAELVAKSALDTNSEDYLIQKVMKHPDCMETLDLDLYSETLEKQGKPNMKDVLGFIVKELTLPFAVDSLDYSEPEPIDLFYMCTRESKHAFRAGSLVQGKIVGYNEEKSSLRCRLECGALAFIESSFVDSSVEAIRKNYPKGKMVKGRIMELTARLPDQKDLFFRIKLSLLKSDTKNHSKFINIKLDESFVADRLDWIEEDNYEENLAGQKYIPRTVNHPRFYNIGMATACDRLSGDDIGGYIFRPSSKGPDHLTCTWKFYDSIYVHLDIIEEQKPASNMVGRRLKISSDIFDSLNEIVDRYLVPCAKLTKDGLVHPKFVVTLGVENEYVDNLIQKEKLNDPSTIPYKLSVSQKFPQYFLLSYMPQRDIIREYIKVKPKGFFFHEGYHSSMTFLIHWFKRHYNDRIYRMQLKQAKEPLFDNRVHYAIPPRIKEPLEEDEFPMPLPRDTPVHSDSTPFLKTPRIGAEEWAGGKELSQTPRADHYEHQRNFENWKGVSRVPVMSDNQQQSDSPSQRSDRRRHAEEETTNTGWKSRIDLGDDHLADSRPGWSSNNLETGSGWESKIESRPSWTDSVSEKNAESGWGGKEKSDEGFQGNESSNTGWGSGPGAWNSSKDTEKPRWASENKAWGSS